MRVYTITFTPCGLSKPNLQAKLPFKPIFYHESVIFQLTEEQLSSILAKVAEPQESGASFDEVKYTVDTFLEENGIEPPSKGGTFIDTIT